MVIQVSPEPGNLCMVRPTLGIFVVTPNLRLTPSGWAIIVLSACALVLGGCGRKGPLDLPPNAMNSSLVGQESQDDRVAPPGATNPGYSVDGGPTAPQGRKKPFVLDPLLGN
jgi:predicted small lipoprotein YifL